MKHRITQCHFKPGHLGRSVVSGCDAITDMPRRSLGFHPAAFLEILPIYIYNHAVLLWPIPIEKVCLVCVTPLLTNVSSVPETEKAKAGQKHTLNVFENKSLSWVSKEIRSFLGRGTNGN